MYVGLMSGTSMDGVDAVLCRAGSTFCALAHAHIPFPAELRHQLLALQYPGHDELHRAAVLANQLADVYTQVVVKILAENNHVPSDILAIGCHGQTIRHQPSQGYTLQIGNMALLAEKTGIRVVSDFRSADIAAGGQGAPLVPAFHQALFAQPGETITVANIGGMANLTYLPSNGNVIGFDCGPGNVLMDAWIHDQRQFAYDANGDWAASGQVNFFLLEALLANPFFALTPPKSCGREQFDLQALESVIEKLGRNISAEDVQATLLALTAISLSDAVTRFCVGTSTLLVCGGGARNQALMNAIQLALPSVRLTTTAEAGLAEDWVEAAAFAWLAYRYDQGLPGNLPTVTGAKGLRILATSTARLI
jgi:anhydro-N-acetylmuramic acid kinase